MSAGQIPHGTFVGEASCTTCRFMLDEYVGLVFAVEFADPDTGLTVEECPDCGADLSLQARGRELEHRDEPTDGRFVL
jgi:hypothetical protein